VDVSVRALSPSDLPWAERLLDDCLGGRLQARLDELIDVLSFPGLVAEDDESRRGLLTYRDDSTSVEIASICSELPGAGRALIDALKSRFPTMPIWLVTTNDNLRALRTYQRQGFALTELHRGAVTRARNLKPDIPLIGENKIPIRDELVLRYKPPGRP
jgi:hypothetical protein